MRKTTIFLSAALLATNNISTMEHAQPLDVRNGPYPHMGTLLCGLMTCYFAISHATYNANKCDTNPSEEKILADKIYYKGQCIDRAFEVLSPDKDFNLDEDNLEELIKKIKDLDFSKNTVKNESNRKSQESCLWFYDRLTKYEEELQEKQTLELTNKREFKKTLLWATGLSALATALFVKAGL